MKKSLALLMAASMLILSACSSMPGMGTTQAPATTAAPAGGEAAGQETGKDAA